MYRTGNYRAGIAMMLCVILTALTVLPARAEALSPMSEGVILMDADTGQILYEKNSDKQLYPASVTKIMTAMLAFTELDLQQELTASADACYAAPKVSSGFSLRPGEKMTVEQLMYALTLCSANDAANVLAEGISGSMEDFARHMNEQAEALGAGNTHFVNANGVYAQGHYTTAYDMALITAAALKVPGLADFFCAPSYSCAPTNRYNAPRKFYNDNSILKGYYSYEGVLLSKRGWAPRYEGSLTTAVKQGDTTLIAVVLDSWLPNFDYRDTQILLDYGFQNYIRHTVTGEELAEYLELEEYIPTAGQRFSFLLPVDADPGEVRYFLGEGTELQTEVTVSAAIGDTPLPEMELLLEQILPEPEPIPETAPTETEAPSEPPAEPTDPPAMPASWLVFPGLLAAAILILLLRRRSTGRKDPTIY